MKGGPKTRGLPRLGAATAVVAAAVVASGCFESHGIDDAADAATPPGPGEYAVGPAPGEGTLCPGLDAAPPGCSSGGVGLCDAAELGRALAAAAPGEVVRVGRCRVEASLTVPGGVTLAGVDRDASVVAAPAGRSAIELSAGAAPSIARCLTVHANPTAGVTAVGAGEARLEHVTVRADTGVGVSAEDVGRLSLHGLDLVGPVTPDNADGQPLEPTPEVVGTFGLELRGVRETTIYGTTIRGFAHIGLLAIDSPVTLRAVGLSGNLGTGALFDGAPVCARQLSVEGVLQGTRLVPAYGLVFTDGAALHGAEVSVVRGEGFGILQASSSVDVEGVVLEGNLRGGLWLQSGGAVVIRGPGSRIVDNGAAGLYACHASVVSISDTEISRTTTEVRISGSRPVEVGMGLFVGATESFELTNVLFRDNETMGLAVDLGSADRSEFDAVHVAGTGDAFGALAFDGGGWLPLGGWDDGVTREGAVEMNDALGAPETPEDLAYGCPELRP